VTKADLHHLVDDLPDDAVNAAAQFIKQIVDRKIDPDQLWFWTPDWQAKEREVDESIRRGEPGTIHMSDEEFLAALEARSSIPKP